MTNGGGMTEAEEQGWNAFELQKRQEFVSAVTALVSAARRSGALNGAGATRPDDGFFLMNSEESAAVDALTAVVIGKSGSAVPQGRSLFEEVRRLRQLVREAHYEGLVVGRGEWAPSQDEIDQAWEGSDARAALNGGEIDQSTEPKPDGGYFAVGEDAVRALNQIRHLLP